MLQGIDVSHHNAPASDPIVGVDFAFVRASYGCTADAAAEAHLERLAAVPIRGVYHYLGTHASAATGETQAAFFLARHAALEQRFGPLAIALDTEPLPDPPGVHRPWDPVPRVFDAVLAFAVAVQTLDRPCLAYGSREWWQRLRLPWWFPVHFPLWAASAPPAPEPWKEIVIQQVGVRGVDRDTFDGTPDELRAVFGLLDLPSVDSGRRTLRRGDAGGDVHELQLQLNRRGAALALDGRWGPATDAAVRAFQRGAGLRVDGIVGPATWRALLSGW